MEKSSERETHDFMNVQSFSQLPFIRPPPLKEKPIKLFGIEFPNSTDVDDPNSTNHEHDDKDSAADTGESNRRFECHYCCRNFPTSQALGGHQNAHKRERQHAKRAQLHSVMLHNHNSTLSLDSSQHLYNLMNYHRLGSAHPTPPITYPTWHNTVTTSSSSPSSSSNATITTSTTTSGRFYGGSNSYPHHQLQPINGSPLALWRIPAVQSNPASLNRGRSMMQHHHPLPLFAADEINVRASQVVASASQNRFVYDSKPSVQDHVSLDLHL